MVFEEGDRTPKNLKVAIVAILPSQQNFKQSILL